MSTTSLVPIEEVIPTFLSKYTYLVKSISASTPSTLKHITQAISNHFEHTTSMPHTKLIASLDSYMKEVRSYLDNINIGYETCIKEYKKGMYKQKITLLKNITVKPISSNVKPLTNAITSKTIAPQPSKPISEETFLEKQLNNINSDLLKLLKSFSKQDNCDEDLLAHTYFYKLHISAHLRNIPFTMTISHLKKLLKTKKCYYLNVPLTASTFTVDRLECDEGYTNSNTVASSNIANQLKNAIIETHDIPSIFLERILLARAKNLIKDPEHASLTRLRTRHQQD